MNAKAVIATALALLIGACDQSDAPSDSSGNSGSALASAPAERFSTELPTNFVGEADCRLTVDGAVKIDGLCYVESRDQYGYYATIFENEAKKGYFAMALGDEDGRAQGHWNGGRDSTHAHSGLGTMTRKGACWISESGEICLGYPVGGAVASAGTAGGNRDLSTVSLWSCDGASGPFEMMFTDVSSAPWGKWGSVTYTGDNPFGFPGDNGFTYELSKQAITIGQDPEAGEAGIEFVMDANRGQIVFISPGSGDGITCRPS